MYYCVDFFYQHWGQGGRGGEAFNPFMPTVAFNICCPRDCVSRHNGGTAGAPLKPPRDDSALRSCQSFCCDEACRTIGPRNWRLSTSWRLNYDVEKKLLWLGTQLKVLIKPPYITHITAIWNQGIWGVLQLKVPYIISRKFGTEGFKSSQNRPPLSLASASFIQRRASCFFQRWRRASSNCCVRWNECQAIPPKTTRTLQQYGTKRLKGGPQWKESSDFLIKFH